MIHKLHMLLRAIWRKYPQEVLASLMVLLMIINVAGWLLMFYLHSKGGR
jgi:hypothetical protein